MAQRQQDQRRTRGESRRRALRTPVAIAAVIAVLAVSAVAVRAFASDSNKAKGCNAGITLTVAVAPDIHTAVEGVATRWAGTNPKVNGQCVRVDVRSAGPADVAGAIAEGAGLRLPGSPAAPASSTPGALPPDAAASDQGKQSVVEGQGAPPRRSGRSPQSTGAEGGVPAVWIPDSVAWIARIRAIAPAALDVNTPSIALTPVVLAMTEEFASSTLAGKPRLAGPDLTALVKRIGKEGVTFDSADPTRNGAALAGAILVRNALGTDADKTGAVVGAYRSVRVAPSATDALKGIKDKVIVPATEQAVVRAGTEGTQGVVHATQLEQPLTLDYPLAVVSGQNPDVTRAAERFRTALTSGEYRNILSREGFRAPNGAPSADFQAGHGITLDPVQPNPVKEIGQVEQVLGYWAAAKAPSRVLSLIDVTSSMKQSAKLPGGGSATRIESGRKAVLAGLALLDDASESGVWGFGATSRELAPMAPLGAGHRAKVTTAVNGAAVGAADTCGLYDAVLSAYQTMRDSYQPGRSNTVVVLTDGANTAKSGLTADQLREELRKAGDPARPVRLVLLGIGPDANMADLESIAGNVDGTATAVPDLATLTDSYLQALLRP
ncbi:MAG TPA: substrate-binding domain-containing protein [Micromonosporaceae bacterium]|nr:substrate-binding domain-containing protein [Micromonosporaceae bacterium]